MSIVIRFFIPAHKEHNASVFLQTIRNIFFDTPTIPTELGCIQQEVV